MKKKSLDNIHRLILTREETLYCRECQADIPIHYFEDGTVIVNCPKCIGECVTCDCHLAQECFSDVPRVHVIHPHEFFGNQNEN